MIWHQPEGREHKWRLRSRQPTALQPRVILCGYLLPMPRSVRNSRIRTINLWAKRIYWFRHIISRSLYHFGYAETCHRSINSIVGPLPRDPQSLLNHINYLKVWAVGAMFWLPFCIRSQNTFSQATRIRACFVSWVSFHKNSTYFKVFSVPSFIPTGPPL